MITTILITICLLSVYLNYRHTSIIFSKNGKWSNLNPDISDIFNIICPIKNTVFALLNIFYNPYREDLPKKKSNNFNKFFNIKK